MKWYQKVAFDLWGHTHPKDVSLIKTLEDAQLWCKAEDYSERDGKWIDHRDANPHWRLEFIPKWLRKILEL